jgi:outer membrane protein assembly factor BamB
MQAHPFGQPPQSPPGRPSALTLGLGAVAVVVAVLVAAQLLPAGRPATSASSGPSTSLTDPSPGTAAGASTSPAAIGGGVASPSATGGSPSAPGASITPAGPPFPGGLLIADRANNRLMIVNDAGRVLWRFPRTGSLPAGWSGVTADDAFLAPDGRTIVANDEFHETIVRIDLASAKVIWTYGHYGRVGSAPGYLHTPDDAYPLANGDIVVADIENCRVMEIAPDKRIVRQWGHTGVCRDAPPAYLARPNGDTPLPDGGLLITEITGSRVVRLAADGHVVFDIHVPVAYPSDAQLDPQGNVVIADFSAAGQVVSINPATGAINWRWAYPSGPRHLDHPSLATPLADGTVSVNDDFRHRIVVINPATGRIVWQYGHTDVPGRGSGYLNTPDGHQPLPASGPF